MKIAQEHGPVKGVIAFDMDNTLLIGRFIDSATAHMGMSVSLATIRNEVKDPLIRTEMIAGLLTGVPVSTLLEVVASLPIVDDAVSVVKTLKQMGFAVGIVSDSYDIITEYVRAALDMDFSLSNTLYIADGAATGKVRVPEYFKHGKNSLCSHNLCKGHALHFLSVKYDISLQRILSIGDSENDICMVRHAGLGIAFCTECQELLQVADHDIQVRSFSELPALAERLLRAK